jgi:hypothetical protein
MHSMENRKHCECRRTSPAFAQTDVAIAQFPGNGLWIAPHSPQSKAHKIILTPDEENM